MPNWLRCILAPFVGLLAIAIFFAMIALPVWLLSLIPFPWETIGIAFVVVAGTIWFIWMTCAMGYDILKNWSR